jgi:hypothetical protein
MATQKKNPHAAALGRMGGRATNSRKATAARANGKKGGRPRVDTKHRVHTGFARPGDDRLSMEMLNDPEWAVRFLQLLAMHLTVELDAIEDGEYPFERPSRATAVWYLKLIRLGRALSGLEMEWNEVIAAWKDGGKAAAWKDGGSIPAVVRFRPTPLGERYDDELPEYLKAALIGAKLGPRDAGLDGEVSK